MLVNMEQMVKEAAISKKAIPGFNVFGYEDAMMVIKAAQELNAPAILMSNKDAVAHMDVKYQAALYRALGQDANIPVCVHLDHGGNYEICAKAIAAGFTSVMYDGSQLPIDENISNTKEVVKLAHACGVSVEAEIGSVGYNDPTIKAKAIYTDPQEAKRFAIETGVDALAVAVGTLHRMQKQNAKIQYELLEEIQNVTDIPLVIHGSTGLSNEDLTKLSHYHIGKINIGTALRMTFGNTLREEINGNTDEFDRIKFFKKPMKQVKEVILDKYKLLGW
ncbi:class II fructose-bisphosphate aldolase [Vallitalea guaymasensis]|uniref:Class II fructose-bisphosphate aldolase n=1 Tax=Vallitalea guaymasensis TaxID=1185412 RepID=A0A8J8MDF3_9FIRM|nr:class II fructose-bisphosphate aldolase [Vallitalea guaymasensis]QUH30843.1 class II fructose-bisphosphate aldolase [Vallitalea guaymasensis]